MNTQTIPTPKQYIVAEDGKRVGVVLDWEEYQHLQLDDLQADPDLLHNLSEAELKLLAEGMLAPPPQTQLNELLQRNQTEKLSQKESVELDNLLARVDLMNILKARALYTLQKQG
jgi:hypothetical protein